LIDRILISLQLALLGLMLFGRIGLELSLPRQIIGFICLIIVPGLLIFRVLGLRASNVFEAILYCVGLSISFLYILGLCVNFSLPLIGVSEPLSTLPLATALSLCVILLMVLGSRYRPGYSVMTLNCPIPFKQFYMFFILLFTVLGTFIYNNSDNYFLFHILFAIIIILSVYSIFKGPSKIDYTLAIYIISISLLFYKSLIGTTLWGWDIHEEYYFAELTRSGSIWNPSINNSMNSILSVTMLPTMFANICDMDIIWIFKIFYPLIFALIPIGLYLIVKRQMDERIAFLSCLFLISQQYFYGGALYVCRQQIAELFFILLLLIIIDRDMNKVSRSIMLIAFSFSLVVSHYSTVLIYAFLLIPSWLVYVILENHKIDTYLRRRFSGNRFFSGDGSSASSYLFSTYYPLFIVVVLFGWYMMVSNSSVLISITEIGRTFSIESLSNLLSSDSTGGVDILLTKTPLTRTITKGLYIICEISIAAGLLYAVFMSNNCRINRFFCIFALADFGLSFASMAVPYFTFIDTPRMLHLTSLALAPFCIIGFVAISRNIYWFSSNYQRTLILVSCFMSVFLLFNCGSIYDIVDKDNSYIIVDPDNAYFTPIEIQGAQWIGSRAVSPSLYVDYLSKWAMAEFYEIRLLKEFTGDTMDIGKDSYIYLSSYNINNQIREDRWVGQHHVYVVVPLEGSIFSRTISNANLVFQNGGSSIYYNV